MRWFRRRAADHDEYENRSFWNTRYRSDPDLGSGVGSRGELAARKRALVEQVWTKAGQLALLDVGFGDLNVLDLARFPNYVGVDVSDVAVQNAQSRFPDKTFVRADFAAEPDPKVPDADMVLCLDVLIHQLDGDAYRRMVRRLVSHARSVGLVSGYDRAPDAEHASEITAYHEPLTHTLTQAGACNLVNVAEYRGLTMILFRTDPGADTIDLSGLTN